MIDAILFDFDGLILDTETPIFTAWQKIYAAASCSLTLQEYAGCIGATYKAFDPFADLEIKSGLPVARDETQARVSRIYNKLITENDAMPGIRDLLASARQLGIDTAVASNSTREWVSRHLSRLGLLESFNTILTREDVACLKPAPDLYLAALEALGVEANNAIALEDSPSGVAAARRAGLFAIAIPNELTRFMDLKESDLRIESLASVPLPILLERIQLQKNLPT